MVVVSLLGVTSASVYRQLAEHMKGRVKVRRIAVFGPLIVCAGHKQVLAVKTGMPAPCSTADKRGDQCACAPH